MKCINCAIEYDSQFCPDCGEKLSVPKITFASMFASAIGTLTNMDKGFLFNLKSLLTGPKRFVELYLKGKRKNVFNPISFLIISVTIYLVISAMVKAPLIEVQIERPEIRESFDVGREIGEKAGKKGGQLIKENFKYFWILTVFWLSLLTRMFYGKLKFAEHLAVNSFIIGIATIIGCLTNFIFNFPIFFDPFVYLVIAIFLYKIHSEKGQAFENIVKVTFSTILFHILLFIVLGLLIFVFS